MTVLSTALSHQECLERLEIEEASLSADWVKGLTRIFPLTPSLRCLILDSVGLDDACLPELLQGILENLDLKELSVANNALSD